MVSWSKVRLIFVRELRDQLRDRRTLFMIAVLPMLLYPALGIGVTWLASTRSEQPRTVVLLGKRDLPPPPLLDGNRFVTAWFDIPADAEKLEVITDEEPKPDAPATPGEKQRRDDLLSQARAIRTELDRQKEIRQSIDELADNLRQTANAAVEPEKKETYTRLLQQKEASRQDLGRLFARSQAQVLIFIPEGFGRRVEEMNRKLTERTDGVKSSSKYPRPEIVYNRADDKSQFTFSRVKEVMDAWESNILKTQLELANLSTEFTHPVDPTSTNLALEEQVAANLWGMMFPALLVVMAVTGAFYPAIDLCAGEKERGTMETLLICPATRTEIVLGKFFTVMVFSCATALLNLVSMGMAGRHMVSSKAMGALAKAGDISLPSPMALVWIVVLLIPLSALFSALCLALATFARSTKEGQYYLSPMLLVTLGLTVFCISPGVDLTPMYSVMPIAGIALLLKGLLLSPLHAGSLYWYAIPVLITSFGYSALAIWWAIEQFKREDVLFREAERFELALWVRHLLRDKEPTPSFSEAGFCFVLIMLLQFAAMRVFAQAVAGAADVPATALRVLMIQQIAIIGSPALLMGIMLTTSIRNTFRLHWPPWPVLGAALILPCVLHPLTLELQANMQQWFFPPLPKEMEGVLRSMSDPNLPLWLTLLAFAAFPAFCEEIAFRGFILSGFGRQGRTWLAIVLSSLLFGMMHIISQQVFNAALLGLVLGMLAIKGNSLWPCVVFHFVNNALAVLRTRLDPDLQQTISGSWFFVVREGQLRYHWPALLLCAAVAVPLLRWLVVSSPAAHADADRKSGFSLPGGPSDLAISLASPQTPHTK